MFLINNVRLIDAGMDAYGGLLIQGGKIAGVLALGTQGPNELEVIDGKGMVLMPAFVDLHAHFRDPGLTHKEDLETGSRAALAGGYGTVNLMANTQPVCDSNTIYADIIERGQSLDLIHIEQVLAVTQNFDGQTLSHWDDPDQRIGFLSDDGKGIQSARTMYDALIKAKSKGLGIMVHAEDASMTDTSYRAAEDLQTIRDSYLAVMTGARVHFSHVSTRASLEVIRQTKAKGARVTCEVTPHHLALWDSDYRVNPPIRSQDDVEAVIEALKDGTADAIATDHAPHTDADKAGGAPGMIGLETAFALAYKVLVQGGHLTLSQLSEKMSANPARILGLNKGRLVPGFDADFCLVDLNRPHTFTHFESKSSNSPFKGETLPVTVLATWTGGKKRYERSI